MRKNNLQSSKHKTNILDIIEQQFHLHFHFSASPSFPDSQSFLRLTITSKIQQVIILTVDERHSFVQKWEVESGSSSFARIILPKRVLLRRLFNFSDFLRNFRTTEFSCWHVPRACCLSSFWFDVSRLFQKFVDYKRANNNFFESQRRETFLLVLSNFSGL